MTKIKRKIIKIDEEKCDGCGLCIPNCPEGALQIVDGKAKLVKESFCDGLGACLGECPNGALTIEEKEAEEFDDAGAIAHMSPLLNHLEHPNAHVSRLPWGSTCPSTQILHWENGEEEKEEPRIGSELRQWPVQLHLVSPQAPYFENAELVLIADCVPFAYANLHADFIKGKAVVIGCPKFDDVDAYIDKIEQILKSSDIESLKVVNMEVPCCYGFVHIAREALKRSGKDIPFEAVTIGIRGEKIERAA